MTRFIIILAIIFSFCLLWAQEVSPWQFVRHSAVDANGQLHIRFNASPTATGDINLLHWQNNAWQEATVNSTEPLTYETLLAAQTGQTLSWRLRNVYDAMGESIVAMNPAYLSSDAFPPALAAMAYVADDPVGDSVMVYYPNLDITGTWFGCTETKIFAGIGNQTNSFSTMNSFSSFNMYFAGLVNAATALTDSTIYAMVYTFSIPGVISPGLYKLGYDGTTPTFQRLGNVSSQVVSGKLMLSCNIADLTADPAFGTWPPDYNAMGFVGGSMRIDVDFATGTPTFNFGDYSAMGQMIFEHYSYAVGNNAAPVITDVTVGPGVVNRTLTLSYSDANEDFPLVAEVVLDNDDVISLTPNGFDFSTAVTYTASLPASGWTTGNIRMSDNNITFTEYAISSVANQDAVLPVQPMLYSYPNPFNPALGSLNIAFSAPKKELTSLDVYNSKGQLVRHLNTDSPAGAGSVFSSTWDGSTDNLSPAVNGIYLLKLQYGSRCVSRKIIIVR